MNFHSKNRRSHVIAVALGLSIAVAGCGSRQQPATATAPPAQAPAGATSAAPPPVVAPAGMQAPVAGTWSPEALEELLAPVALYPDPVLSQVLIASTNPQEVLDAGNWLLQNQSLNGKALDDAAAKVGFTPPIRALIQFPETVDMMCMQLDWTTELGQAFVADQQGVLDAVQRLRRQARDVGNLQSSDKMKVDTQVQDGKEVVVLEPPKPDVVYVPQYDPKAVYAPPPPATTAAAPAATTTSTTTTTEEKGHSTGSLVATGLLAFGAGMLVNEIFDDDEDDYYHGYGYPNYGYGGMPYYPPYPYRPAYGNGYYPANGYTRPPNYQHGFNNNNVVVINNGQNNYWNDRNQRKSGYQGASTYQAKSPITAARPNRPELQQLNKRQPRPMPADVKRPSPDATRDSWRSQGTPAAAGKGGYNKATAARPMPSTANAGKAAREPPKVQGSYAGATPERVQAQQQAGKRPAPGTAPSYNKPASRDAQPKPSQQRPAGDRGYDKSARPQPQTRPMPSTKPQPMSKPAPMAKPQQMNRPAPTPDRGSAVSGANRGSADRAASQRGKQSMPQGARSKGGGGAKKQGR